MTRTLLISVLLAIAVASYAQKVQKVTATYTYYAPEHVTLEEAKRTALDRAKIQAIANAFGTLVTQSNSTVLSNQNGKTDSRFFSLGGSEIKGEWIETTKEPVYNFSYEGNMLAVSVEVSGRIREIVDAGIDFTAKILRNGTEERFESSEFRSGDDMYLYFKSPVDGYLTVYLLDEATQEVYCLLPYIRDSHGSVFVKSDKEYVFFKKSDKLDYTTDEYTMIASQPVEFNTLYVIFSQKEITKASDKSDESQGGIRVLGYEKFNKWLIIVKMLSSANVIEKTIKVKQ
ncbi:MAG: DUF4384 domain-containing protein [Prevotella sp.]|nr:DUF4384 domain-containing protein [Prevotella sp.]